MNQLLEQTVVRIAGITNESVVDGCGLRSTVFFQGCIHACPGCHNPETWDPQGGKDVTLAELVPLLKLNPLIEGVTFSGGEPFLQSEAVAKLAAYLKGLKLSLWIYTGFTWEYLIQNVATLGYQELLKYADVLIDGPFLKEVSIPGLLFRGSTNQRMIKIPESLSSGAIIYWEPQRVEIR